LSGLFHWHVYMHLVSIFFSFEFCLKIIERDWAECVRAGAMGILERNLVTLVRTEPNI
jgi:hypothetical protein